MTAPSETVAFLERARAFKHVVVLTGAGISVASGLSPYRGPGGLWTTHPELATQLVAGVDPNLLWKVTCEWRNEIARAKPNSAHAALARFEDQIVAEGGAFTLITQNVDGLHAAAGSNNVIELHGAVRHSRCSSSTCVERPFVDARCKGELPLCTACGAPIRPDIVLFQEMLGALEDWSAKKALRDVDLFIAIGTSGTVSPASNFVRAAEYSGAHTVLINLETDAATSFREIHRGNAQTLVPRLMAIPTLAAR